MLLVVICDKMVASFERLSQSCQEVHRQITATHTDFAGSGGGGGDRLPQCLQPHQQQQDGKLSALPSFSSSSSSSSSSADPSAIVNGKSLFVGAYEVDLDEERCYLVQQLVMLQLGNLATFGLRLKDIANRWSWDVHKTMLSTIDKRLQDTAANVRRLDVGGSKMAMA